VTENEAVEYLLSRYLVVGSPVNPPKEECEKHNDVLDLAITALEAIQQYRAIGTIDELQALKEKTIAEKPLIVPIDDTCLHQEYRCPSCNEWLADILKPYRCKCGKLLDWSK
jgi:hypothetical protein